MRNLSAVVPKIWCDLHLLRILAEGRRGSFLALSRGRSVLSLCLPCPDRAILSLGETQCFWRGCGLFALILGWLSRTGNEGYGHNWKVRDLEGLKGLRIKKMTSHCTSYMGSNPGSIYSVRISKKSYKRDKSHPTPNAIFNRWICIASWRELIKDVPRAPKRQERDVSKTKGMSHNQEHVPSKWRGIGIDEGRGLASCDIGPTSPKPSSSSDGPDSRILRGYCGAKELVTPAHFTLRPKARAEEGHCRGHIVKVQMA